MVLTAAFLRGLYRGHRLLQPLYRAWKILGRRALHSARDRKYVLFGCETAAAVAGLESGECPRACDPVAAVTENPEVFFLTGPDNTAQELCRQLMQAGFGGCRAYVGEKLSYPEERIVSGTVRK